MFNLKKKWQTIQRTRLLKTFFSQIQLENIKQIIDVWEKRTSGEIRVKVIFECDADLKGKSRNQALREFECEGLSKTRDKTGVLILVVLLDKKFEILADKGIYEKIKQTDLDKIADNMKDLFLVHQYHLGVSVAIRFLGLLLQKHFPRKSDDINELPNDVIIGGEE